MSLSIDPQYLDLQSHQMNWSNEQNCEEEDMIPDLDPFRSVMFLESTYEEAVKTFQEELP